MNESFTLSDNSYNWHSISLESLVVKNKNVLLLSGCILRGKVILKKFEFFSFFPINKLLMRLNDVGVSIIDLLFVINNHRQQQQFFMIYWCIDTRGGSRVINVLVNYTIESTVTHNTFSHKTPIILFDHCFQLLKNNNNNIPTYILYTSLD